MMQALKSDHAKEVLKYVEDIKSGNKIACVEQIQGVKRFSEDLESGKYEFREDTANLVIDLIETQFTHRQGETIDGVPLRGTPFLLLPWQKYIIYNLVGFYYPNSNERRFKEAFIYLARKNGKTLFAAALAWSLAVLERKSGSNVLIVGDNLKQALQSFKSIRENLSKHIYKSEKEARLKGWRILDNNMEHSVENINYYDGSVKIEALASNPDGHDSLNSNIQICDELHAYKTPKQYQVIKDSGKSYTNRLCIGITTAGHNKVSFCYRHFEFCQKILNGTIEAENMFVFVCKADEPKDEDLDFTDMTEHEKANPSYGITIRPRDMYSEAIGAKYDPQKRNEFLAKSLNVYTSSLKSYFDIQEFKASDEKYNWTIEQLAKLPVAWFGGADLSKLYDLTAVALYGRYKDVDIVITHGFFPITQAYRKAEEDGIPIFGWKEDGFLTATNSPTVNYADVVNWFKEMREKGFKIREVGFDRKFSTEFFQMMKSERFKMIDEPQLVFHKSQGFKRIEKQALDRKLYYLHSQAFEYCVQNVHAVPVADDAMKYEKATPTSRIDLFDAAVFACMRMLNSEDTTKAIKKWLGVKEKDDD